MVPARITTDGGCDLGKLRRRDVQSVADGQKRGDEALTAIIAGIRLLPTTSFQLPLI